MKNPDFTPKNLIFSNFRGGARRVRLPLDPPLAWLSHRFQRVVVDGHTSNSCPVLSGIPQGSVLSPCLFLIYINDMPDTHKSNVRLFADDIIFYLTISALT